MMIITEDSMEVLEMGEGDALSLLSKSARLNDTCELAKQLVSMLGCIPLAIDQAGAYMMTCRCPLDDYLELYRNNQNRLMSNPSFRGASGYGSSTYGTWEISMKEIEARTSKEIEYEAVAAQSAIVLYKIFAFLHHEDIPEEMFRNSAENYMNRDINEEMSLGLPLSVTATSVPSPSSAPRRSSDIKAVERGLFAAFPRPRFLGCDRLTISLYRA